MHAKWVYIHATAAVVGFFLLSSHCDGQTQTQLPSPNPAPSAENAAPLPVNNAGLTSEEQARKAQETGLGQTLVRLDAAATLMGRGQVKDAIAAYLPVLQNEPNFDALAAQKADLASRTEALQQQIFQVQRQDPSIALPQADGMAAQKIALEGQLAATLKLLALQPSFAEAHANLAHLLLQVGTPSASLMHYQQAIRLRPALKASLRPAMVRAHLAEADRLAKLGRPEAVTEYKAAIGLDPADASAHYGLGSVLLALDKAGDAVPELQEAVQRDPAHADAALTLGLALYRSGHEEDARQQWRRLAEGPDANAAAEAHGMLDRYLLKPAPSNAPLLNVLDLEIQRCREQVRNYPNEASTHNNLSLALFHAKQKSEALQEVQTALHLNPDSIEAHTNLGRILDDKAQGDEAVEEYKRALKLDSENGWVHNDLGAVYFGRQQWKQAEYEFRKALEDDHSDPFAHHNLASVLLQEGRLQESIKECAKTIQYDPAYIPAFSTRGLVEDKMGQSALGLADLKLVVHADADPAKTLLDLENPLLQFAGHRLAAKQFREILRLYPQTADGEQALGRLLLADGQDEEAVAEFRIVNGIDPNRADSHFLLARALLRLNRLDAAEAEAREALRLEPQSADALNTLGLALYQSGQTKEGRAEWEDAAKSDNKDAARNAAGLLSEFP